MQGEDDLRGLAKIMAFMRAISILLVLMNFYWFCYSMFLEKRWTLEVINRILSNFNNTTGLFSNTFYTKIFAFVLLALSCIGTKGVKNEKITWSKINGVLVAGLILYFVSSIILSTSSHLLSATYMLATSIGYILLMVSGSWMTRLLRNNLMDDVFNN